MMNSIRLRSFRNKMQIYNFCKIRVNSIENMRYPEIGDEVILNSNIEKNGLKPNLIVKIIGMDLTDDKYTYRINVTKDHTCWFSKYDIILNDPNSCIPKPNEPDSNDCCGSNCPDCVWLKYWERLHDYERRIKLT